MKVMYVFVIMHAVRIYRGPWSGWVGGGGGGLCVLGEQCCLIHTVVKLISKLWNSLYTLVLKQISNQTEALQANAPNRASAKHNSSRPKLYFFLYSFRLLWTKQTQFIYTNSSCAYWNANITTSSVKEWHGYMARKLVKRNLSKSRRKLIGLFLNVQRFLVKLATFKRKQTWK